ncbi:uncharacterized protein LOC132316038 [Cornus florida]|uniref:uncharacterized protein LOC132316038 n=1 Tax=Cornus florida TaxID=4283 RepID=UPI0028A2A938|nr:uncharacterized protein LOC132316038 [Cornus florida]XP_059670522.1 uncharacterized protein LOC132316038 [Cornus florida]
MSTHINELKEYLNASFLDKKVRVRGFVPEDHHSVPEMVSIGPHFSNLSLPIDDNVKIQLASFLIWSSYRPVSFDSYKAAIEDILEEGMQFYSETSPSNWTGESTEEIRSSTEEIEEIRSSTEEIRSRFRSMFLLDGCFIVYLIDALCNGDESGGRFFGIISAKKCYRDLCLLLNQIPFVVVQKLLWVRLYGSKSNSPDVMIKVHQHLAAFCRYIISGYRVRTLKRLICLILVLLVLPIS